MLSCISFVFASMLELAIVCCVARIVGEREKKKARRKSKKSHPIPKFSIDESDEVFDVTSKFLPNGQLNNGNGNGNRRSTNDTVWQLQFENAESVRKRSCHDSMRIGSISTYQNADKFFFLNR